MYINKSTTPAYFLNLFYFYLFDFTAAIAADRPVLSARAGWRKKRRSRLQNTVGAWTCT